MCEHLYQGDCAVIYNNEEQGRVSKTGTAGGSAWVGKKTKKDTSSQERS